MPPRLRSQPFGPDSPNAVQSLPDPPRRRRATRSASAQPQQEDKPAQPVREPKARKTRGKAASRGRKKATRRTSLSPSPLAEPQPEQLEGADSVSGAEATGQMQDPAPASPFVEIPVTVLPSIENSEPELTTQSHGVCESPASFSSARLSHSSSVVSPAPTPSDSSSSTTSTSTEDSGNQPWGWMSQLRNLYRVCTHSYGALIVPAVAITAPAVGWSLDIPVLNLNMGQSETALDDIELISIIRAVRSTGTASNRRLHRRSGASPSSSSEQSRVLRAQGASPIHRSRTSYAKRSNSRRIENRGSFGRTLYRLPQLLSLHSQPELQNDSGEGTNPADEQDSLNLPPATAVSETPPPATPERVSPATPMAPMTAPPAGTDVSPGWSRWIFNGVSRRWTVLRNQFAHHNVNENENQPDTTADEPAVPTAPATPGLSAAAIPVAPASTAETIQAGVSGTAVASTAPTSKLASPSADRAQTMTSLPRGPSPSSPPRRAPALRRPRRRTFSSFVDTRTLLSGNESTSIADGHKAQHEFVKRRQAARLALEKEKREAKIREEKAAQRAAAAAAAARDAARRREYHPSNSSPKSPARVSGGMLVPSNSENRSSLNTRALAGQLAAPDPSDRINRVSPLSPASQITHTTAKSNVDAEKLNPRKRSRGFGLDEDDLAVHEDDFTPEEWEALKAEVEKAEEDAAIAAQENAPPTKKRRVDTAPKQQKRTRQSVRHQTTGTPRQTEPPSRTPGYIPNRRGTLAPPDLSPIDSSRLLTDPDSPLIPQAQAAPSSQQAAAEAEGLAAIQGETEVEAHEIEGSSPLTRARNKAEQFKPKTPSRLRESTRIPSSNASTPSALGISSPSFNGVSTSNSPYRSDPMSVDGSSFVANPDATPVATTGASSTTTITNTIKSAVNEPERSLADDVAWLSETLPNGNFKDLKWPPRTSLVEALDIDPEAVTIVGKSWQEKGPDAVKYFETLFQAFKAAPDEFVLTL